MHNNDFEAQITQYIGQSPALEPSSSLLPKVLSEVRRQQEAAAKRKFIFTIVSFAVLLLLNVVMWGSARLQFAQSGSCRALSLLFSDTRMVFSNWQEYGLMLLETLPASSLALALASVAGLLFLFKLLVQTARQVGSLTHK